jgi:hypothetical protein
MTGRGCPDDPISPCLYPCTCTPPEPVSGPWPTRTCTLTLTRLRPHACLISHRSSPSCLQHYSLPPSLSPSAVRVSVLAQRRSGLGLSGPWWGGPSSTWRGDAMALTTPVMGRPAWQGPAQVAPRWIWLPLLVVCAMPPCHVLLAALHSCRRRGRCLWWTPYVNEPQFSQTARRCCTALEAHVASVCYKRFIYFRGMLQVLHMDVAKVDQEFCTYCIYCKCFRWMLQAFV